MNDNKDSSIPNNWPAASDAGSFHTELNCRNILKIFAWQINAQYISNLPDDRLNDAEIYSDMVYDDETGRGPYVETTALEYCLADWMFSTPTQIETDADLRQFLAKLLVVDNAGLSPQDGKIKLIPMDGKLMHYSSIGFDETMSVLNTAVQQFGPIHVMIRWSEMVELLFSPM